MSRITHRLQIGHELLAAVSIGALSALLAAGLGVLGLLNALNGTISRWVGHATPRSLPVWLPWLAAGIAAPLVATLWSGVCAVVYARNHHMASDRRPVPTDAPHEAR